MNPVRQALYEKLADTVQVSVYHREAPADATTPFVLFTRQSGIDVWALGARAFENELWLVKAVDRAGSASAAEDLADQLDTALNDAQLAITGRTLGLLRRQSVVDYPERDGAETYQHVGGLYRLISEEN